MKPAITSVCFTFLLLLALTKSSYGQTEKAEKEIHAIMQEHAVVGLSVAVVKKGDIIYSKAFGLKDIETNKPLAQNDIFRIASISKSFSATAIMQLVEAGKLSLEDDFSKLVGFKVRNPNYPNTAITLKMVLSHTSSINDSQGYFTLDAINPAKNPDWAKCYNNYEPGKGYEYCNLNFNMVGTIIEKLSGERFDQYIKQHILTPLNLYGGYCVDSLDAGRFTTLYAYDTLSGKFIRSPSAYNPRRDEIKSYVMSYSTPVFSPTGGMKISAPDLAKYMTMHMQHGKYKNTRIISRKSSKLMQKPIAKNGYGMALTTEKDLIPGKMLTGHTGTAYGLYSAMFFHPKEKFGIVVITNGCSEPETDELNKVIVATINSLYQNLVK
ncbi:serine hydrolase domain-containing protein [Pontibacter vulgaris]|uniref:serine hydrolase domain-containing protein n=1 Tax=Pontibacter vulgaris TaxID=2905679 RepID=UPI001FA78FFB|nr:serine hydrolase domain-containing protein [Pontibacter vulgaris]